MKRYRSSKTKTVEGWTHESIELIPDNKEFSTLRFVADDDAELSVIAEFVGVLKAVSPRQQDATS